MLSVRALAAGSGHGSGLVSVRGVVMALAEKPTSARLAFAAHAMDKGYTRRRRFSSHLGLPVDANGAARNKVTATASGAGYLARFRSGVLALDGPLDGEPKAEDTHEAEITFVGLECINKQEVTDEVLGSVSYIRPSDKTHGIVDVGERSMGTGQRIIKYASQVYAGAMANITVTCSLVEKDSGNTQKYRDAFAKVIADGAKLGAAEAGVPAEALAADSGWMNDLSQGLSNLLFDLLGADDDAYNAQTFMITAKEMQAAKDGKLEIKTLKRDDDPNTVDYTHRQPVTGKDDGGDLGEYAFYFLVRTRPRPEVPEDFS